MSDLRLGQAKNEQGVSLFASENLIDSGGHLIFNGENVVTESSNVLIRKVDDLPTASSSDLGKYILLSSDNTIRECVYSEEEEDYSWEIKQLAAFTCSYPLVINSSTSVVSIDGIDTVNGSEQLVLTQKGTFVTITSLNIDSITKNWIINGEDTNVSAQGQQGPTGPYFIPSVSSSGIISWTNTGGLENPASVNIMGANGQDGQRGTKITIGIDISGTNQVGQIFSNSGLTGSLAGDFYLNSDSWNLYLCTVGGEPSVATWIYLGCLQGPIGPALKIDAKGLDSAKILYNSSPKGFIYFATDSGLIYQKNTDISGDWSAGIQFRGDKGDKGDQGEIGPAFSIDASGSSSGRSQYDDEAANFVYMDTDSGNVYIKLSATHAHWSNQIPFRGPKGDKGDDGTSPVIEIDSTTKHWIINGVDTGIVAEGTGDFLQGQGITIDGKTISIRGINSSTGSENKYLNQKGEWREFSSSGSGSAITIDTALNSASNNPVTNSAITTELNKKITNPSGAQNGQFLSWNGTAFIWATPTGGGGTSITVDSSLSDSSTNPVQNKVIKEELDKKITAPAGPTAGQVLCWTGTSFAWITPSSGSGSGTDMSTFMSISKIIFKKPVSDEELYPKIIASQNIDFSNPITIDPHLNSSYRSYFTVFNGETWNLCPIDSGLGSPYDGMMVAIEVAVFSSLQMPFYLKYCWKTSDGTESNYESTIFPSAHTFSPEASKEESLDNLLIVRPKSDESLYPYIECSENPDFSDSTILNTLEVAGDRNFVKVFNGFEWIDFPYYGLGTPFDDMPVNISMAPFVSLKRPFYVRYSWMDSEGSESNYLATVFPSANASVNTNSIPNPVSGSLSGMKIEVIFQSNYDNLEEKDPNTLYLIVD